MKQAWINKALFFLFPFLTISGLYITNREKQAFVESESTTPVVNGRVVDATTNKPLSNTHVYIIHGEEEDMTNEKGAFSIRATGSFPLTLNAERSGYQRVQLQISKSDQASVVKLSPK